jgi:phosphoglycerate dehydrogenase-like enzyme
MDLVAVTYEMNDHGRTLLREELAGVAEPVWLPDLDDKQRTETLRTATVMLARNTGAELHPNEPPLIGHLKLIQFVTAGIDFVPLSKLPPQVPVAGNGGAYAEPMAEHAVAMALAAAKRLLVEHAALSRLEFNQFTRNRMLAGGICGILGFGGVGVACARLFRAIGMKINAINRRGSSDEPVDWIGTPAQLDELLAASDVLVISTPLSRATTGMIAATQLERMKPDAILVNLARGEIVDEAALFAHLQSHPKFTACIDAWWIEPVRHGVFRMDHPFLSLPNVIGSPHNSASVPGAGDTGLRRAAANIRRVLRREPPRFLISAEERMR